MPADKNAPDGRDVCQIVIDHACELIAESGVRATTLRAVGQRSGINFSTIAQLFGSKEELIAACFQRTVLRDHERTDALMAEAGPDFGSVDHIANYLWAICEEAAGHRRRETIVLAELLVHGAEQPRLDAIAAAWIEQRRQRIESMLGRDRAHQRSSIITRVLIAESIFMAACHSSARYRIEARSAFAAALVRLIEAPLRGEEASANTAASEVAVPPTRTGRSGSAREGIVDATADLIAERGLDAVTNRSVAARAKVSLALTTYHFASLSALRFEGIELLATRLLDHPMPTAPTIARGIVEVLLACARGGLPSDHALALWRHRVVLSETPHAVSDPDCLQLGANCFAAWDFGEALTELLRV